MMRDDEVCLKLGREIVRMIRELQKATNAETGYTRREFTYPGGAVNLLIVNDPKVADVMEAAVQEKYKVEDQVPPSQIV